MITFLLGGYCAATYGASLLITKNAENSLGKIAFITVAPITVPISLVILFIAG